MRQAQPLAYRFGRRASARWAQRYQAADVFDPSAPARPRLEDDSLLVPGRRQDHAIPPESERFMAERMHAHTTEIDSSHVAMITHAGAVTAIVTSAAKTTS